MVEVGGSSSSSSSSSSGSSVSISIARPACSPAAPPAWAPNKIQDNITLYIHIHREREYIILYYVISYHIV